MDKVTKNDIEVFAPDEGEKLEILADLINGDYTVEALRQDYKESLEN